MSDNRLKPEISAGDRFEFGRNWQSFLSVLNDERIANAERATTEMMGIHDLTGYRFLDVGSGSGLFSLVARRLNAEVHSFDFDPQSVACTRKLKSQHFPGDGGWVIQRGSILDGVFMESLGLFDIVYAWGVLHHTADLWEALDQAASRTKKGGLLFVAIYNDQGWKSDAWRKVKRTYCSGRLGRALILSIWIPYMFLRTLAGSVVRKRNVFAAYKDNRGMSIIHDWYDWLGGYPFETASVEDVFHFLRKRHFSLKNIKTVNGNGNNQFVFVKDTSSIQSTGEAGH